MLSHFPPPPSYFFFLPPFGMEILSRQNLRRLALCPGFLTVWCPGLNRKSQPKPNGACADQLDSACTVRRRCFVPDGSLVCVPRSSFRVNRSLGWALLTREAHCMLSNCVCSTCSRSSFSPGSCPKQCV